MRRFKTMLRLGLVALAVAAIAASGALAAVVYLHHHGSYYFNDISPTDGAGHHIGYAVESGVTAGCAPGRFCPDAYVTRRQMAVFLQRQAVNEFLLDWLFFDVVYEGGWAFGEEAYRSGRITFAEYESNMAVFDWMIGRVETLAPAAAAARGAMPTLQDLQAQEAE